VYQPAHMSPEKLQELYDYAWSTFYKDESQEEKMTRLFIKVMMREMEDGTWVPRDRRLINKSFGKDIVRTIGR
ncbi:MAG: radical SAM protein, partial [Bacteroidales bacterium]|nr:radical SAM protein [Bacteroidales bacterium]